MPFASPAVVGARGGDAPISTCFSVSSALALKRCLSMSVREGNADCSVLNGSIKPMRSHQYRSDGRTGIRVECWRFGACYYNMHKCCVEHIVVIRPEMFRRKCFRSAAVFAAPARRATSTNSANDGGGFGPRPLDGVRVIDMSRVAAGPYCAMVLADMGADVIKVERPVAGDDSRRYGPPFVDVRGDGGGGDGRLSLYFVSLNRNKRSVCVDFRQPDGRAIIRKLVERSHVLIENYIPGTLDRWETDEWRVREACDRERVRESGPWRGEKDWEEHRKTHPLRYTLYPIKCSINSTRLRWFWRITIGRCEGKSVNF